MSKNKFNKKAIDIVRRLPTLQQITASQSNVVAITPAWLAWSENKLSAECAAGCELSSLVNGKLIIVCHNASYASQIKHQQKSLLDSLNVKNSAVETIAIRIHAPSTLNNSVNKELLAESSQHREKPSDNALKAIKNCQKSVSNENLATSLASLVNTLQGKTQDRK